jgi:hypothetical protein
MCSSRGRPLSRLSRGRLNELAAHASAAALHTISLPLFPFAYASTSTPPFVLSLLHSHSSLRQFRTAGNPVAHSTSPPSCLCPLFHLFMPTV